MNDWKEKFDELAKKLNLREETVTGFDERVVVSNFIESLLATQKKELAEKVSGLKRVIQPQSLDDLAWQMRDRSKMDDKDKEIQDQKAWNHTRDMVIVASRNHTIEEVLALLQAN